MKKNFLAICAFFVVGTLVSCNFIEIENKTSINTTFETIEKQDYEQKFTELSNILVEEDKVYEINIDYASSLYEDQVVLINSNYSLIKKQEDNNYLSEEFDWNYFKETPFLFCENLFTANTNSNSNLSRTINSISNISKNIYEVEYTCTTDSNKTMKMTYTINQKKNNYTFKSDAMTVTFSLSSVSNDEFKVLHKESKAKIKSLDDASIKLEQALTQDESEYYLFVYTNSSVNCNKIKENILDYMNQYNSGRQKINLYPLSGDEYKTELCSTEENYIVSDITELKIKYVPTLLLVKNGSIVGHYTSNAKIIELLGSQTLIVDTKLEDFFVTETIEEKEYEQKFAELTNVSIAKDKIYDVTEYLTGVQKTIKVSNYYGKQKFLYYTLGLYELAEEGESFQFENDPILFLEHRIYKKTAFDRTIKNISNIAPAEYKVDYTLSDSSTSLDVTLTVNLRLKEYTLASVDTSIKINESAISEDEFDEIYKSCLIETYTEGRFISPSAITEQNEQKYLVATYSYENTSSFDYFIRKYLHTLQVEESIPYYLIDIDKNSDLNFAPSTIAYYVVYNGKILNLTESTKSETYKTVLRKINDLIYSDNVLNKNYTIEGGNYYKLVKNEQNIAEKYYFINENESYYWSPLVNYQKIGTNINYTSKAGYEINPKMIDIEIQEIKNNLTTPLSLINYLLPKMYNDDNVQIDYCSNISSYGSSMTKLNLGMTLELTNGEFLKLSYIAETQTFIFYKNNEQKNNYVLSFCSSNDAKLEEIKTTINEAIANGTDNKYDNIQIDDGTKYE